MTGIPSSGPETLSSLRNLGLRFYRPNKKYRVGVSAIAVTG